MILIKPIDNSTELKLAHEIRHKVFVIEQAVDEDLEYEFEEESNHYIAFINGKAAGTARWRETSNGIKLERFAVLKTYRHQGVASALLSQILQDLKGKNYLYLHAQTSAMPLYSKFGFKPIGDLFYEANIPHFKMILTDN